MVAHQQPPTMVLEKLCSYDRLLCIFTFIFLPMCDIRILSHVQYILLCLLIFETLQFSTHKLLYNLSFTALQWYAKINTCFRFLKCVHVYLNIVFPGVQITRLCVGVYSIGRLCAAQYVWNAIQVSNSNIIFQNIDNK